MNENTIVSEKTTVAASVVVAPSTPAKSALTIEQFMLNAESFLNERCPKGSGLAASRAEVALAGGLTAENDVLISALIGAGFMPNWKIRQGRDGGVCRIGEEPNRGPNVNKYGSEWLGQLVDCLNKIVSLDPKKPTPRDKVAYAMAALTGEEILKLPNKISEAISLGKCPGFASKRGAGIYRTGAVVEAPAVSAEGIDEAAAAEASGDVSNEVSVDVVTEMSSEAVEVQASTEPTLENLEEILVETEGLVTVEALAETFDVALPVLEEQREEESTEVAADASTEADESESQEVAPETTPETAKAKGRRNRKS